MQVNGINWVLSGRGIIAVYGPCKRKSHVGSRIHGPCTRPVHVRVHGPSAGDTCTQTLHRHVYGVHGKSTWQLHDTYTAAYTCLRVQGPCRRRVPGIYTAENGRLHGRTRPCNVSCLRPCTLRIASCTRQPFSAVYTGRVHCRFRPST